MAQNTATDELPGIKTIDYPTRVGEAERPAVVIWFANDTALRYVWNEERGQIEEQTYVDGAVDVLYGVGGSREDIESHALQSASEYLNEYRFNPDACEANWPRVYDMLTVERGE